ncbi:UDP-2,4-diacetamido-2,4,6-trideoxy-beta-L-altropyranose hydrolase [bacterium]|nr:MAG: UDP-2,4-diacetamido-2,4,6-trideoxy-beta-L-altropyranose hydrolase [bacterium]
MRLYIRADSSLRIGTGHIVRCMTVATALRGHGFEAVFICRTLPGDISSLVEQRGFDVRRLPPPVAGDAPGSDDASLTRSAIGGEVGWLIVDHYALDARWERAVRPCVEGIVAIDDLADRPHACDALLDQGLHADAATRYGSLVEPATRLWLGPAYALLRDEFVNVEHHMRARDGRVRRLLISLGGSDPRGFTSMALEAVRAVDGFEVPVDVVVPASNPHRARIAALAADAPNVTVHGYVERISDLMRAADLAIGAGGTTTWERCAVGLPTILLVLAENQASVAGSVEEAGAAWNLGDAGALKREQLGAALARALRSPEELRRMSAAALALMRGAGTQWLASMLELVGGTAARDSA